MEFCQTDKACTYESREEIQNVMLRHVSIDLLLILLLDGAVKVGPDKLCSSCWKSVL